MSYQNPAMDKLIDGARFAPDEATTTSRREGLPEMGLDEVPLVPLFQPLHDVAMQKYISGYRTGSVPRADFRFLVKDAELRCARILLSALARRSPALCGVVIVTFLLTRVLPGDPATYFAGPAATPRRSRRSGTKLGLDQPLPEQFVALCRATWRTAISASR